MCLFRSRIKADFGLVFPPLMIAFEDAGTSERNHVHLTIQVQTRTRTPFTIADPRARDVGFRNPEQDLPTISRLEDVT